MSSIRGQRAHGSVDDDVGAMSEHVSLDADRGNKPRLSRRDLDAGDRTDRFGQGAREIVVGGGLVHELVVAAALVRVATGGDDQLLGGAAAVVVDTPQA